MPEKDEQDHLTPAPIIDHRWRWAAAVLGLGGLGAGGTAVFITDVEAGPVALLVVGLVLIFIAMGGHLPSKLKFNNNEIELQAAQDFVAQTLDDATPEEKPEELRRIGELASVAPALAAPALEANAWEQAVTNRITYATYSIPGAKVLRPGDNSDIKRAGADLILQGVDGGTVFVYVITTGLAVRVMQVQGAVGRGVPLLISRPKARPVSKVNAFGFISVLARGTESQDWYRNLVVDALKEAARKNQSREDDTTPGPLQ